MSDANGPSGNHHVAFSTPLTVRMLVFALLRGLCGRALTQA
jgi:hypothetical protein